MNDVELMTIIDNAIDVLKKGDGFGKKIKVSKKPHSDWLVFEWRQLSWNETTLTTLLEFIPILIITKKSLPGVSLQQLGMI
jgi:hypothetical protein